jgi:hypothetical protein
VSRSTPEPLAFFTLDRGTATTAAALIGRVGGRFRLLGHATRPAGSDIELLLEHLVRRAIEADSGSVPDPDGWHGWARLEVATPVAGRILLAAATERRLEQLEVAAANAGWDVVARVTPDRTDALAATAAALSPELIVAALAGGDPIGADEREILPDLAALLGAVLREREDVLCLLSGGAGEQAAAFPADRLVLGPPTDPTPAAVGTPLRSLLEDLARRRLPLTGDGATGSDGRAAFRVAITSLAALLERRIEGVDIGHSGGSRVLANIDGPRGDLRRADAALVPRNALTDDRAVDEILRWSPIRADAFELRDRVRNLRRYPWRDAGGDGARLRLAAARAALARLDSAWQLADDTDGRPASTGADLLVASGGPFDVAPPPAVALALADTLRRPGGIGLFHDHARILAPLGTLESEADRRRLLADLLDDALVPLGSAIIASGLRPGRHAGTVRVTSDGSTSELELVPGAVQLVDLPPGLAATVELETREGVFLGVRSKRVALDVVGGLGGLLVDTRDIPLRLPERAERRRELLDAWQRPLWLGSDG